jgi:hypothetical protein
MISSGEEDSQIKRNLSAYCQALLCWSVSEDIIESLLHIVRQGRGTWCRTLVL